MDQDQLTLAMPLIKIGGQLNEFPMNQCAYIF